MQKKIELATSIASLIAKLSIAVGALVVLAYCINIGFYPKNIQIGDGLFFIWSTLVFGFLISFITLIFSSVGFSTYIPLYLILKRRITNIPEIKNLKDYTPIYFLSAFILIGCLIGLILVVKHDFIKWLRSNYSTILITLAALMINGFILSVILEKSSPTKVKLIFILALFITPILTINGFLTDSIYASMRFLGIRNLDVSVYIDNKYKSIVSDSLDKAGINSHVVIPIDENYFRLDKLDILFHGVGETSYLKASIGDKFTQFSIPSDSLLIEKDSKRNETSNISNEIVSRHSKRLDEMKVTFDPSSMVFKFNNSYGEFAVGQYKVSNRFKAVIISTIREILPTLVKNEKNIESIEIIGLASNEWKKSDDSVDAYKKNIYLSVNRANEFTKLLYESKYLLEYGGWLNKMVVIKGMSSSTYINNGSERTVLIKIRERLNK